MTMDHIHILWQAGMNNTIFAQGTTETDNQRHHM